MTIHHVIPKSKPSGFAPNSLLEITPIYLEQVIHLLSSLQYKPVALDCIKEHLLDKDPKNRFVCFTLDDGYGDNYRYAKPIFEKYSIPYTVYVNTGMPDGRTIQWWRLLEEIVGNNNSVTYNNHDYNTANIYRKYKTYASIYWHFRSQKHAKQLSLLTQLTEQYRLDALKYNENSLDWKCINEMSKSPLVTIGAHTVNHYALSKLNDEELRRELQVCRKILYKHIGYRPRHFCYPFGDPQSASVREYNLVRKLGYHTAVTTVKSLLYPKHSYQLFSLPRLSLNGHYQDTKYLKALLSGGPFALLEACKIIKTGS